MYTFEQFGYVIKNGILAFQRGIFSQWHGGFSGQVGGFKTEYHTYAQCEQWMMAEKARLFKDDFAEMQIMSTTSPSLNKEQGRLIKNFNPDVWDQHKYNIVFQGNLQKFSQNQDAADFLKSTGDLILVESSPWDKIWGSGTAPEDERTYFPHRWLGENLLGKVLMQVRSKI